MIAGYKTINPYTQEPAGFVEKIGNGTKIHTIRRGNRWGKAFEKAEKEGRALLIQHSIGVRTKGFYNFQTNVVKSVQKFELVIFKGTKEVVFCRIDGNNVLRNGYFGEKLANNDGFEHLENFAEWFYNDIQKNGEFIGEIVHWTDLKY